MSPKRTRVTSAEKFYQFCRSKNACSEGLRYIEGKTIHQFWDDPFAIGWVDWLLRRLSGPISYRNQKLINSAWLKLFEEGIQYEAEIAAELAASIKLPRPFPWERKTVKKSRPKNTRRPK